jgi:hypothetical protein
MQLQAMQEEGAEQFCTCVRIQSVQHLPGGNGFDNGRSEGGSKEKVEDVCQSTHIQGTFGAVDERHLSMVDGLDTGKQKTKPMVRSYPENHVGFEHILDLI